MDEPGEPPDEPVLTDSLRELCAELARVQAQARALGLFVGDHPLLECPNCHLVEDVTIEGFLVVYRAQDFDLEATPRVTRDWDTGLRFVDLSEDQFLCPACGTVFSAPEEELPAWLEGGTRDSL